MGESLMGSVFRVWIYLMMIILFVGTFLFVIAAGQSVRYQHQATAIIERNGGPTANAIAQCNTLGRKGYHGFFQASAKDNHEDAVQPGADTGYEMHISIPYKFVHKNIRMTRYIATKSSVRDEA